MALKEQQIKLLLVAALSVTEKAMGASKRPMAQFVRKNKIIPGFELRSVPMKLKNNSLQSLPGMAKISGPGSIIYRKLL